MSKMQFHGMACALLVCQGAAGDVPSFKTEVTIENREALVPVKLPERLLLDSIPPSPVLPIPIELPSSLESQRLNGVYLALSSGGPNLGFMQMLESAMQGNGVILQPNILEALVVLEIDILIARGALTYWQEMKGQHWFKAPHQGFTVLATIRDQCGSTLFEKEVHDVTFFMTDSQGPELTSKRVAKLFRNEMRRNGSDLQAAFRGFTECR